MSDTYANMGVNVAEADQGIAKITAAIKSTWPIRGFGRVVLENGYFANVIDVGDGKGLASTTDGVGSKTIIADLLKIWNTIGIDCVANNVNDLICLGAVPVSMLDYIGVEKADAAILGEIGVGLAEGARQAEISISGGEVSQLPDNIRGFDLIGAAHGYVELDRMILGQNVMPGDIVIGIGSNGIHSNGLTMARRVLFERAKLNYVEARDDLEGRSIGEELLRPTYIYVNTILGLICRLPVKALINITGDGLLNLLRAKSDCGYTIEQLPQTPPIFDLIRRYGNLAYAAMFETFNMGIGFCVVVAPEHAGAALRLLEQHHRAWPIGYAREGKSVTIVQHKMTGHGKTFRYDEP